ncbi:Septal ring factor EnvC, activator of murein hydrolases AmiA and AmiB [Fodinibius roseus]|uniref:Septal ring factor EnvC, activator of murein hydrolases AmiA and AmiB n=1 Tax=Fodinibius roseus TaxID=1194090 RepID=A0A1M4ZNQ6_9BACT|nr:peptidoglycan DD-metalloendopeptidase family protein [Fodinibius roseus]SHF19740.1 Septal ring factor EnvC, activator of murein hydrolases AmiA and AmiB [Fodinibius roseus]
MNKTSLYITFFCCFFGASTAAVAQDGNYEKQREELLLKQKNTRAEINKLNEQIDTFEQRLQKTSEKYANLYEQFEDLQRLITLQDQKISKLQAEQSQIQDEIAVINQTIAENQQKLEQLIENYKETLQYIYKHGQTSELALLFASSSVNQMLIRAYYLRKFNTYREAQVNEIRETEEELKRNRAQLEDGQERNKRLLAEIRAEKETLARQKQKQESNVALLRQDKERLQQKLDEIQQQKESLNNTLTSLIREEEEIRREQAERIRQLEENRDQKLAEAENIEDEEERAREVAKYAAAPAESEEFLDDEELREIEISFAQNKGELPWPVESSTILEHFGRQRHPVYGTVTPNLGIEILSDPKAPVKAVHPGYVIAVQPFPGYGDVVLVKHGRFITAYGNLSQVSVRDGSILQRGDIVGLSGDQASANGESVFFLVRENNDNLDPENWLRKK